MSDDQWYTPPEEESPQPDKTAQHCFVRGMFAGIALTLSFGVLSWVFLGVDGIESTLSSVNDAMRTRPTSVMIWVMIAVSFIGRLVMNRRTQAAQERDQQHQPTDIVVILLGGVVLAIIFGLLSGF